MGSPKDEEELRKDEEPAHNVVISEGFWLFDTPVTQGMWELVMGSNPSQFQDPRRPVEQVSWEECQFFMAKVGELVPGLQLSLPTEAQWEYACRGGTTEATYGGPIRIIGENNAPVLDEIAWYGGNSGVGFELEEWLDASHWPNKQHKFSKAGTRRVGEKKPNPWGLYDMLGNVWEWCLDRKRNYTKAEQLDPVGPEIASADRVARGGSWRTVARAVRAACRHSYAPSRDVDFFLGFRCRVQ